MRARSRKIRLLEAPTPARVGLFLSERLKSHLSLLLSLNVAFDADPQTEGFDWRHHPTPFLRLQPVVSQIEYTSRQERQRRSPIIGDFVSIVFGYSHLGRYVAEKLDELELDYVVVTTDPQMYATLVKNRTLAVLEHETRPIQALKEAGIERDLPACDGCRSRARWSGAPGRLRPRLPSEGRRHDTRGATPGTWKSWKGKRARRSTRRIDGESEVSHHQSRRKRDFCDGRTPSKTPLSQTRVRLPRELRFTESCINA